MERAALEEEKMKESRAEKNPKWRLYCHMTASEFAPEYWTDPIDAAFEASAGDEEDRWRTLQESY